jgi:HSP20 family protein
MAFLKKTKKQNPAAAKDKKTDRPKQEGEIAIDVFHQAGDIVIQAPIAGVEVEDLDISVDGDTIEIKGDRERSREINPEDYLLKECWWGPFSRKIILPFRLDGAKAKALIEDGVLVLRVPKLKKRRKIEVIVREK